MFLGEIFQIHSQTKDLTRPKQQKFDPTQPGSKNFDLDPSLDIANQKSKKVLQLNHENLVNPYIVEELKN